jgi:predicted translin family RNA/ssDNA-binding protein
MPDFKDFKKLKLGKEVLDNGNVQFVNPINDMSARMKREREASIRVLHESRVAKEQEEMRRHNELVAAINRAAENGATIVIGDNANGIQIQQNSDNAKQFMTNSQTFNYEKTLDILNEIREFFDYPQFEKTFQDKSDLIKQLVEETVEAVKKKEDPSLIKKSLKSLKDLTISAGGSLIATGILGLLSSIPV